MNLSNIYYLNEIGAKKKQEDYIWPAAGSASLNDRIFIVCDGVGGSQNGEIASRIVSESVGNALLKMNTAKINIEYVNQLLSEAKAKLLYYAKSQGLSTDMATTFTLLAFSEDKAFVGWCGDSRVYQIRNGEVIFKTEDHSLVNSLVKSGDITEQEAVKHPQKNIILKAIKADESDPEADGIWLENIQPGDYFLLCTDGLLENIGDRDLRFLLEQNDKGAIDLVLAFQQFCYGKTNDNYSMYLLQTRKATAESGKSRNFTLLILFFLLLAFGGFLLVKRYFPGPKPDEKMMPLTPAITETDTVNAVKNSATDTTPLVETIVPINKHKDSVQSGPGADPAETDSNSSNNHPIHKIK
jgi:PPM family protein phosphatase